MADPTPPESSPADKIFARVGDLDEFLRGLYRLGQALPTRVNADEKNVERGLARLVLTLIDLLRQLMERQAVRRMETTINTRHRLPALEGKTPQEFVARAKHRYPPADYDWRTRDLRGVKGKVTFIRFVRKSGRITVTAKDKFLVGKKYKWQYVTAVVDVVKQKLRVLWQGKLIRFFDYH